MKKVFLFINVLSLLLVVSCSDEPLLNENQNLENNLIIKKINYLVESSGYGENLYFNLRGQPIASTNADSSTVNRIHIYNSDNKIVSINNYTFEGIQLDFNYSSNKLEQTTCFCFVGLGFSNITINYTYNGNIILAEAVNETLNHTFIYRYTFLTENRSILIKVEYLSDESSNSIASTIINYEYDDNLNVIKEEQLKYNESSDSYVLDYYIEQTFDDKNNVYNNVAPFEIMVELFIVSIGDTQNGILGILNRFSKNNILTRSGFFGNENPDLFNTYNFEYIYNTDEYPISSARKYTNGNGLRTYTFEYY